MNSVKAKIVASWQAVVRDPIVPFGVVSFLLLIALAIAPLKDHFSEWRHYQQQYVRLIRSRGDAVTLQRHFEGAFIKFGCPRWASWIVAKPVI